MFAYASLNAFVLHPYLHPKDLVVEGLLPYVCCKGRGRYPIRFYTFNHLRVGATHPVSKSLVRLSLFSSMLEEKTNYVFDEVTSFEQGNS